MEKELTRLLENYHHFIYMTQGPWRARRMDLYRFMLWLKSRKD